MDWVFIVVFGGIGLFLQYWVIRLAVAGGLKDFGGFLAAREAEEERWRQVETDRRDA